MGSSESAKRVSFAIRKNVRDEYELKIGDAQEFITQYMGTPWTVDFDYRALYPYATDWAQDQLGLVMFNYVQSFYSAITDPEAPYPDSLKTQLNEAAHAHVLSIQCSDNVDGEYCCCRISPEGKLVVHFARGAFGVQTNNPFQLGNITKAVESAPKQT